MANENCTFTLSIQGPDNFSAVYELPIGVTTIGRDADNLLRLDNRSVSRHHARIDCIEGECELIDLDSSNGVFVNGVKIPSQKPVPLKDGDQIKIGPHYVVTFHQEVVVMVSEMEEAPVSESVEAISQPEVPADEGVIPPPILPPPPETPPSENGHFEIPPGLSTESYRLIRYLPEIYHDFDFLKRFLAIFEAILFPIEWNIDNFDLFLSPATTPVAFLPWLANWLGAEFDSTWTEAQRRTYLAEAHALYARRGTKWALHRVLEIYTGHTPEIDDEDKDLRPHSFLIRFPFPENAINRISLDNLIHHYKPAHTDYELLFQVQS